MNLSPPAAALAIVVVVLVTGLLIARVRREAEEAKRRAGLLDRLVRTHTAIAMSDDGLDEVLETVVDEALDLTGADAAVVELLDGDELVVRAVAGIAAPQPELRLPLADVPLIYAGRSIGVLKVYSSTVRTLDAHAARLLALLGNVVGPVLARAEFRAEVSENAQTDALTGLANRRSWENQLVRAIAHAERTNETVSVAVCTVDDRYGHAAGDSLIREIAERWTARARASDLIARTGRDEFAILLPGADELAGADVLMRLVEALPADCSVSYGIAEWDLRETGDELTARADLRLDAAKRRRYAQPA